MLIKPNGAKIATESTAIARPVYSIDLGALGVWGSGPFNCWSTQKSPQIK